MPTIRRAMASQLLKAIVNRPEFFVAEVRHWASSGFADGKGERRLPEPYDRPAGVVVVSRSELPTHRSPSGRCAGVR
jgi:hypothetical protein